LDASEARWLREAEALQIWRPLGMVSALDYLERVLGYAPRTAQERLRVARALGTLPELTAALAGGGLTFSAVRELTRVATPATEALWIAASRDKNLRQIEELVANHRPGDQPGDPPDPEARSHVVRFELSAETFACLRQARQVLDDEHGTGLPEDAFMAALCDAVLDSAPAAEPTGRAKFQIAVTLCRHCRQGWQEGAGAQIAIDSAAVDRALCDAQHIGSIDGAAPERAHQDISPSVARFVWRRDGGRCRVDGCRSSRGLELHHVVHRADGGGQEAGNLVLLCSSCHLAHHRGALAISGTAERLGIRRAGQPTPTVHRGDQPASTTTGAGAHVGATVGPSANPGAHGGAAVGPSANPGAHGGATVAPIANPGAHVCATDGPSANPGAHVGATVAPIANPNPGAHVGVVDGPSANPGAHVSATAAPIASANPGAHVGATVAPIAHPNPGAHVGGVDIPSANPGAHVSATVGPIANLGVHVSAPSKLNAAILRTQAKAALTGLGWKPAIAHAAVAAAAAASGPDVTLEQLIRASLRHCPVPKA
ncbi:MAG TPA: HNH endonuclease, partial [Kofleriaceae bacterium]|nr:HNH endonuclease [Kofleriaceae bacterium]